MFAAGIFAVIRPDLAAPVLSTMATATARSPSCTRPGGAWITDQALVRARNARTDALAALEWHACGLPPAGVATSLHGAVVLLTCKPNVCSTRCPLRTCTRPAAIPAEVGDAVSTYAAPTRQAVAQRAHRKRRRHDRADVDRQRWRSIHAVVQSGANRPKTRTCCSRHPSERRRLRWR